VELDQLRRRAKDLRRAVVAGEEAAAARVVAAHPKYVDRPADRLQPAAFTLRDAQATLACELGFGSWHELVDTVEVERETSRQRWDPERAGGRWFGRAATRTQYKGIGSER
jgi:hypothetical protein